MDSASVLEDYNSDGFLNLFVANDETPNVLFYNKGDGTFKDVALLTGVAYNADGDTEAGMGVDFADYDNDGDPDLYVTHFFSETNTLSEMRGTALHRCHNNCRTKLDPPLTYWAGERVFLIITMTVCSTSLSQTAMFIRQTVLTPVRPTDSPINFCQRGRRSLQGN